MISLHPWCIGSWVGVLTLVCCCIGWLLPPSAMTCCCNHCSPHSKPCHRCRCVGSTCGLCSVVSARLSRASRCPIHHHTQAWSRAAARDGYSTQQQAYAASIGQYILALVRLLQQARSTIVPRSQVCAHASGATTLCPANCTGADCGRRGSTCCAKWAVLNGLRLRVC